MMSTVNLLIFIFILLHTSNAIPIDNQLLGEPTVRCEPDALSIDLTTMKQFSGRIFVKGYSKDSDCIRNGDYSTKFNFSIGFEKCGIRRAREFNGVSISATVIVSFHPIFITKVDRAYKLNCFYVEARKTVAQQLDVNELTTQVLQQDTSMPTCKYEILTGGPTGPPVRYAKIGDHVYHKWTCEVGTPNMYCMRVHTCSVNDGQGGEPVLVLDRDGCQIDRYVLQNLEYPGDLVAGQGAHVFKFADKPTLHFNCQIEISLKDGKSGCKEAQPQCTGADYTNSNSVGVDNNPSGYSPPGYGPNSKSDYGSNGNTYPSTQSYSSRSGSSSNPYQSSRAGSTSGGYSNSNSGSGNSYQSQNGYQQNKPQSPNANYPSKIGPGSGTYGLNAGASQGSYSGSNSGTNSGPYGGPNSASYGDQRLPGAQFRTNNNLSSYEGGYSTKSTTKYSMWTTAGTQVQQTQVVPSEKTAEAYYDANTPKPPAGVTNSYGGSVSTQVHPPGAVPPPGAIPPRNSNSQEAFYPDDFESGSLPFTTIAYGNSISGSYEKKKTIAKRNLEREKRKVADVDLPEQSFVVIELDEDPSAVSFLQAETSSGDGFYCVSTALFATVTFLAFTSMTLLTVLIYVSIRRHRQNLLRKV